MNNINNYKNNEKLNIKEVLKRKVLILDGATGTQIQNAVLPIGAWDESTYGCNELLNETSPEVIRKIHRDYIESGANIIKTNTFGTSPWTLEEYGLDDKSYDLSLKGAKIAKEVCDNSNYENEMFVAGVIGPGSKIPSFGNITYDELYDGYVTVVNGLLDGNVDVFLLETCQDPLQIKAAIHACQSVGKDVPIMVSITIEENNQMLIGTSVETIAHILDGFDILSIGFNCGSGPKELEKHVHKLSSLSNIPISIHANAGLPQNIGGKTVYPMENDDFANKESSFLGLNNVGILGGCCGTTPEHIKALRNITKQKVGNFVSTNTNKNNFVTSAFESVEFKKGEIVFIGERCNASGSKKFKELVELGDIDGALEVAKSQILSGANVIDLNVAIPGLDENKILTNIIKEFRTKLLAPLMIDSNSLDAIEGALKLIAGKPIINSVNLEDGEEALGRICKLAKKYNTSLVCLAIDEKGMAKTKERKLEIADRIYDLAVNKYGLKPKDLIFDLLVFTVATGDEESKNIGKETLYAIKELTNKYPEVNTTLGLSNISFGLFPDARKVLNSVFLDLCRNAGLTSAIVNVEHIINITDISSNDIKVCEDLLLNRTDNALFDFIEHFSGFKIEIEKGEYLESLSSEEKVKRLLKEANTPSLLELLDKLRHEIDPNIIINEILIEGMKEIGDLFGQGKLQMPFVLASAETMKKCVGFLNQYLEKSELISKSKIVIGTVKGDVHDVGKNLVNIILTNNGYEIADIGTRADIEKFIEIIKGGQNITAIGFSGLLVKSTNVMLENLKYLEENSINIPVLLGGAALNKKFVEEYCKSAYSGPVFYCKDAFDAIEAIDRIEKSIESGINLTKEDTDLHPEISTKEKVDKQVVNIPKLEDIKLPEKVLVPNPPFWGRKILKLSDAENLAFDWLNEKFLFNGSWGYSGRGLSREEKSIQFKKLKEKLELYKKEVLKNEYFDPKIIYGFFPCRADGDSLLIFDSSEGWQDETNINNEPLDRVKSRAIYKIDFPRQKEAPFHCLSDYFRSDRHDVLPLSVVSAGAKFSEIENEIYKSDDYLRYNEIHGIGINLAEALADIIHKQIRVGLNLLENEKGFNLNDVQRKGYDSKRYSFGYGKCPNLEDNQVIFDLLRPEELGITLSETFQMHPEQTTSAFILHHKEAGY